MTIQDPRSVLTASQKDIYDRALGEARETGADLVEVLMGSAFAKAAAEDMRAVRIAFGGPGAA